MLRWSRNPGLIIGLCPDRLVPAADRHARTAVADQPFIPVRTSDPTHWQAAVDILPSVLRLTNAQKPKVTLVLSNHFVRYALLPWNAVLKTNDEWLALARHRFLSMHGNAANDWEVRVSAAGPQEPRIAGAVEQRLLDAVQTRVTGSGGNLISVQPYLMAAFNGIRAVISNQSCWLVIEERGRLTLALILDGVWRLIRSQHVEANWHTALPEMLERENAILALEQPCTQAIICTQESFDANLHNGFQYLRATEVSRAHDGIGVT